MKRKTNIKYLGETAKQLKREEIRKFHKGYFY